MKSLLYSIFISCLIGGFMCACSENEEDQEPPFDVHAPIKFTPVFDDKDVKINFSDVNKTYYIKHNEIIPPEYVYINKISDISDYYIEPATYNRFLDLYTNYIWGLSSNFDALYEMLIELKLLPANAMDYFDSDQLDRPDAPQDRPPYGRALWQWQTSSQENINVKWLHIDMDGNKNLLLSVNRDSIFEPEKLYITVGPTFELFFSNWQIEVTAPKK